MKNALFENYLKWFQNHRNSYPNTPPLVEENFTLKELHTYEVIKNAEQIADFLSFSHEELFLAKTTALFHDLGRFQQFYQYQTFLDRISANHAELSVTILRKDSVLSHLSEKESSLILDAILYHNRYEIPLDAPKKTTLFSKILRDSDKLDIWRVLADYYYEQRRNNKNPALEYGLLDNGKYSPFVVESFKKNECIKIEDRKTVNDIIVYHLSWIFNVYFPITLKLADERKLFDKIFSALPDSPEKKEVFASFQEFMNKAAKCF
ncbi:MAG TPA: metal-dependent phosphohydrolase [Spirochaetia bacterium]|nr:MAG: hypothetical protein A2Y41_11020 [Spirochaetes bacterium GWB1_36_13]HCL56767.1 metal-dependent phosphohydrolase [Spirochaetia bacterium]